MKRSQVINTENCILYSNDFIKEIDTLLDNNANRADVGVLAQFIRTLVLNIQELGNIDFATDAVNYNNEYFGYSTTIGEFYFYAAQDNSKKMTFAIIDIKWNFKKNFPTMNESKWTYKVKRELYESIMAEISVTVKRLINETL